MRESIASSSKEKEAWHKNPKLYGHGRNVDLRAVKKRKTFDGSEVYEIKDLDMAPTKKISFKKLEKKLEGVP